MRALKISFLLLGFVTLFMTSCTKDDVIVDSTDPNIQDPTEVTQNPLTRSISGGDDENGAYLGCFTIDFPFSLYINEDQVEITSLEDLEAALEDVAEDAFIDFVYPFTITYENGEQATIESGEQIGEAFLECVPDDGWGTELDSTGVSGFPAFLINSDNYCVELVFPLELTTLGDEPLFFSFPLTVQTEDGQQEIDNGDDLFDALYNCEPTDGLDSLINISGEFACYDIQYPFSVVLNDGTQVEVQNHEELCQLFLEQGFSDFAYPITLIHIETGDLVVINSQDELATTMDDCFMFDGGDGGDGGDNGEPIEDDLITLIFFSQELGVNNCYSLVFPINIDVDDENLEVNSFEEIGQVLESNPSAVLSYPVSVRLDGDSEDTVLNSREELDQVIVDCN